jgi:hypothetical protein
MKLANGNTYITYTGLIYHQNLSKHSKGEISGSHRDKYEVYSLLGSSAV